MDDVMETLELLEEIDDVLLSLDEDKEESQEEDGDNDGQ